MTYDPRKKNEQTLAKEPIGVAVAFWVVLSACESLAAAARRRPDHYLCQYAHGTGKRVPRYR
jgi:hypothetical protein